MSEAPERLTFKKWYQIWDGYDLEAAFHANDLYILYLEDQLRNSIEIGRHLANHNGDLTEKIKKLEENL